VASGALCLCGFVSSVSAAPVVGTYILAERGVGVVEQLRPGRVTHILYAFLLVCGEGERPAEAAACAGKPNFSIAPHADQDTFSAAFQRLKARDPKVQVLASVGGWGGSDPFFHLAASPEGRAAFVKHASDWLRAHPGFDGLDIDWEHPGNNGASNGVQLGSAADGEHFVQLLQDLRAGLDALGREAGRHYALTVAINTTQEQLRRMPMGRAAASLDLVFMMTYDFAGPWTKTAANHTPLRSPHDGSPDDRSLEASVASLKREGVPASKLVAGVAMYGRGFDGVKADGSYAKPWPNEDGSVAFKDIAALKHQGMKPQFDKRSQSWAMVSGGKFVGYDDPRAVRAKVAFARRQGLAGVFAWELSQDNGEILDAMNLMRP
jgi:chitinase